MLPQRNWLGPRLGSRAAIGAVDARWVVDPGVGLIAPVVVLMIS
jgi:hypothetical protein